MSSTTEDLHDKRSLMSSPENSINGTNVAHTHTTTLEPEDVAVAVAVALDHISQDKLGSPVYISCDNGYGSANVGSTPSQIVHGIIPNQNSELSSVEWNPVQNGLPTYGHQEEHKQDLHAPKYGTLITNRIFIGALPITATENDLLELFSGFGIVTSAKIITDRAGISKGYGFVTFMNDTDAAYVLSTSYVHTSNCSTLVPIGSVVYRKRKVISPLNMSNQPYYQQVLATQPQQNPMPLVDGTSLLPYLGISKAQFRENAPAFAWREHVKPFRKKSQCTRPGSNPDLLVFGSLVQHESSALDLVSTEVYECFFKSFHTTIAFNGSSIVLLSSSSGPTMDSSSSGSSSKTKEDVVFSDANLVEKDENFSVELKFSEGSFITLWMVLGTQDSDYCNFMTVLEEEAPTTGNDSPALPNCIYIQRKTAYGKQKNDNVVAQK
uniref:RRM domain-containing protein n=1 Tax=Timema cristinae TaxID=61476 RepID=A0A7R9H692_TIMCR|nr:unnamed protein product [Timema cristinae]